MSEDYEMTQSQKDALDKIEEIMREHFENGVCVITTNVGPEEQQELCKATYHGGYATAIGLLQLGIQQIYAGTKGRGDLF